MNLNGHRRSVNHRGVSMNQDYIQHRLKHSAQRIWTSIKWIIFAIICGIILGVVGSLFVIGVNAATRFRTNHPQIMLMLPIGAVIVLLFYHLLRDDQDAGTNMVIRSIQSGDNVPLRMAPAIFFSSIFSHLCGASVGREGAALQLGGSVGHSLGKLFHFERKNEHIMIMCGMSAAFSAVFGTPVAAAVFSMEVVSVGIMHYAALVPCVVSSFVARGIARHFFGIQDAVYQMQPIPKITLVSLLETAVLAVLCGLVSILFCVVLHETNKISQKLLKNRYVRAIVLGSIVFVLTLISGDQTFNGTGIATIQAAAAGQPADIHWFTFLLKILFTALSLAAGYKGGEIVPTFFIGASFGYWFGSVAGLSPSMCAAIAMGAMFCGVTNCPITSILICMELFDRAGLIYYVLAVAIAYMASSYYGLYSAQKIVYSKYQSNYINTSTK